MKKHGVGFKQDVSNGWVYPGLGRFIQEDRFEGYMNRPSSLNPYVYVENNPLRYIDPKGYAPEWIEEAWGWI
ncbi:RHS repeat-associated core domain-containing protein [Paenibacillus lemnae]|uniref:RHS repeat-associated core domain-containing protein n=1 Tax=Paenibacillus lemnae TaxID=1330551 RepID=A0A848M1U0_PAELE|nr:RHS repeat-associated core domain-containing protein [Paenibacillus lemnae]NMO94918.1 hypothetical protein [Paenibacillus lemnae]